MSKVNLLMYDPMRLLNQSDVSLLESQGIHLHPILNETETNTKNRPLLDDKTAEVLSSHVEQTYGHIQGILSLSASLGMLMPLWQTPSVRMHEIFMDNVFMNYLLVKAFHHLLEDHHSKIFLAEFTMDKASLAYWGAFEMSQQSLITMQQILKAEYEHRGIDVQLYPWGDVIPPYSDKLTQLKLPTAGRLAKL